jgi:ketosteroid isomerase-like protein
MQRDDMLARVEAAYAARRSGDLPAFADLVANDSSFSYAADQELLRGMPGAGDRAVHDAAQDLFENVELQSLERVEAVAEENRVAIMWKSTVAIPGREPFDTMFFDLWEFNDEGKIRKGTQFIDTAKFVEVMRQPAGNGAGIA